MRAGNTSIIYIISILSPECILIFGLILLLMIDSASDKKDRPWFYFISSISLVMSITALLFRWRGEPMISFSGNFSLFLVHDVKLYRN
ncbi:unnamed protein product [Spirodela intermedia]|uniref:NAD(P)H-quinone oxidoreductase subunit 2 N-terminal domain-containing protein n=1 Tax=Spirodela intermedia TaxID=51605 RepID=A0A7I8LCS4_SPIIN|nr:unnamed protein product [Spirodela intermedia]